MKDLPHNIAVKFEKLKREYNERLVIKKINGKYYVYKEHGIWLKDKHKNKTISEYLGRITDNGLYIKKALSAKDDLENAKALIMQNGGEIIWHEKDSKLSIQKELTASEIDLKLLMALSMNARMPASRLSEIAGLPIQTVYSRIKHLEKDFGLRSILEIDLEKFGFTTYLILVKFQEGMPTTEEIKITLSNEPRVQFAALTKGDYDLLIYVLDENSVRAQDNLWKIMSETDLGKYKAKWYLIPFGQVYSFVPLRNKFIEEILKARGPRSSAESEKTTKSRELMRRESALLRELNNNAIMNFSEIDNKYKLNSGAARYAYEQLKSNGIIIRPTITLEKLQMKYIGIIFIQTTDPFELKRMRYKLLLNELEYGALINKYVLMANVSMPEGAILLMPVFNDELDAATSYLSKQLIGTSVTSLIISNVLVGTLCFRRFDNRHSRQYNSLLGLKKVDYTPALDYE